MMTPKYLNYRGAIRQLCPFSGDLAFVTVHPEKRPTAIWRLQVEKMELAECQLPAGGQCLCVVDEQLFVGGDDGKLYQLDAGGKSASLAKTDLPSPAEHLVALSGGRLAAACGDTLAIVDPKRKEPLQLFPWEDCRLTSLAVSPDGEWLALGNSKGVVAVYEAEGQPEFALSESEKLHDGAVTALCFEPEELRFFSAGADLKLLLTHARGKLEPEDRARGAGHSDQVTGILLAPGDRFITVSRDKSCKTWARVGATRPATLTEGVPTVVAGSLIEIHNRPHLVMAGKDNALRFIVLDAGGRFGALNHKLHDAYDRAAAWLKEGDIARRGEALHSLAEFDDRRAIEMLAAHVDADSDHALRRRAAELLVQATHPHATSLIEPLLSHRDADVRMVAFDGLESRSEDPLRRLRLALETSLANVGVAAVGVLAKLASKNDLAHQMLVGAMENTCRPVRQSAVLALEQVFPKKSPEPTLIAARSGQPETRRMAMLRCFQRELLGDSRIGAAVRRATEDPDPGVRRTAFLVSLLSRPKLAGAVRQHDADLHRQLFELETEPEEIDLEETPGRGSKKSDSDAKPAAEKPVEPPKPKSGKIALDDADFDPALSAMASRVVDTCLAGARCLAAIGDARAFGALLQLSRESSAVVRIQVCASLAALNDPRAAQRLAAMIHDESAGVRDEAYTAMVSIYQAEPLHAAEAGLASRHADVRRRGLQTLVATLRKSKAKSLPQRAVELLLQALNDGEDAVRSEAFKAALSQNVGGSEPETLRFVLNSAHESVRAEVLTEAMANDKQPWAHSLLVELLNDPSAQVRNDAYEHLLKPSKGRDIEPMKAALHSQHADLRLKATQSLIRRQSEEAQEALVAAIDDADREVRLQALQAMINSNAVDVLHQAMESRHADVRLGAASARALFRDPRAREPLLQAALAPAPEKNYQHSTWLDSVVQAVRGLGMLGESADSSMPSIASQLLPLLNSKEEKIRVAAADAIGMCASSANGEFLLPYLQHDDRDVRLRIALALALSGERRALPIVFSDDSLKVLDDIDRLMAAVAYGEQAETLLAEAMDSRLQSVAMAALLTLLFRDWLLTASGAGDAGPQRVLLALSSRPPRVRLMAARALEAMGDGDRFREFLVRCLNDRALDRPNDRSDEPTWSIPAEDVEKLAQLIVFADPPCQARTVAAVVKGLRAERQEEWDLHWKVHQLRFDADWQLTKSRAEASESPSHSANGTELQQLAFGTYVALVREQGDASAPAASVRMAAIRRLVELSETDTAVRSAVLPVVNQSLSDTNRYVRTLAFESLAKVGMSDELRAEAAIESGQQDLATDGLKLLTESAGKQGRATLEHVVRTRADELADAAAQLLLKSAGAADAGAAAIESARERTRRAGVAWLSGAYDDDARARKVLVEALECRHAEVRLAAAVALAAKRDKHAFPALMDQLKTAREPRDKQQLLAAIVGLAAPGSSDALLDLMEDGHVTAADGAQILVATGSLGDPSVTKRLLKWCGHDLLGVPAATAVMELSGHNQPILDPNDELTDRTWLEKQRERRDDVLAAYVQTCLDLGLTNRLSQPLLLPSLRWALSDAVDEPLAALATHADDNLRRGAVEALGWRLRKRSQGAAATAARLADKLVELLEHRDVETRFLAAVGLAKAGRAEGLSILLSAVELMTDLRQRVLAVEALGELGDQRAIELLVGLASDDLHALQAVASEAIGHLGQSDRAKEIFELLKRLVESNRPVATSAVVGLRWLNTPLAWDLIREQARSRTYYQNVLVEQLGYNDDPATRSLLLELLRNGELYDGTLLAARRLFGNENVEPDLAIVSSGCYSPSNEPQFQCLSRLRKLATAEQILSIYGDADGDAREQLRSHLLQLQPLPVAAAATQLAADAEGRQDDSRAPVVELSAQLVGLAAESKHEPAVAGALSRWLQAWSSAHESARRGRTSSDLRLLTTALRRLAWAAGRLKGAKSELLMLVETHREDSMFLPVRRAAAAALGSCKLAKKDLDVIASLIRDPDQQIRSLAAELLADDRGRVEAVADTLLSDRETFRQLSDHSQVDLAKTAAAGAGHAHYQAIALPLLVRAADTKTLAAVAVDDQLPEHTRLGAIEGLAWISRTEAEQQLAAIGGNEKLDEELRKAAWRGLRRSKRRREQAGNR
ncbi:MAG: HEAT repeat domain-containing protein [Planctomycetales bacterium]|nr:HEAT repeat domain-containing protein [Planctomycetales bacterium]